MANTQIDTGHSATITLGTTALSFNWTSIDLGERTLPDIDTSTLATAGERTFVPGDLIDAGEVTVPFQWDAQSTEPAIGTVESCTFTFPLISGGAGAATYAGTGYIKRVKRPNLQTDTLQDGELTIKWDGLTGPTFTAAT